MVQLAHCLLPTPRRWRTKWPADHRDGNHRPPRNNQHHATPTRPRGSPAPALMLRHERPLQYDSGMLTP
jgi:hypothetical protein